MKHWTAEGCTSDEVERSERTLTLLIVAKLRVGDREGLCRIRNVSVGGAMFETRMALVCGDKASVDIRGQKELTGEIRWVRDGRAGLAFDSEVEIEQIVPIAPVRQSRILKSRAPRGPRVPVDAMVEVQMGGGRIEALLRDISQGGAKLVMPLMPARDERLLLLVPGLPMKMAIVRWIGTEIGVAFAEPLPFDLLAEWLLVREGGPTWSEPCDGP